MREARYNEAELAQCDARAHCSNSDVINAVPGQRASWWNSPWMASAWRLTPSVPTRVARLDSTLPRSALGARYAQPPFCWATREMRFRATASHKRRAN